MGLSQRRADSVSSYLAAQGVQSVRLQARGFGPDRPVADNASPEGRQQNRRVEITLEPLTA
jgi:outer membrane protein OmpA-like peptidoglycan-associated protein